MGGGSRDITMQPRCGTGWRRCWATAGLLRRVFLAQAHRAARRSDAGLRDIAELAAAFVPSRERQLETSSQGAPSSTSRCRMELRRARRMIAQLQRRHRYPVAVGIVSSAHKIRWAPPCTAFFHR